MVAVQYRGELLDGGAQPGVLVQQRADRVGDLLPAAVADRDVDGQAAPLRGPLGSGLQHRGGLRRQQVQRADHLDPPRLVGPGEILHPALDDPQERGQLGLRAVQIVGGQQPQGDQLDPGVGTPAQQILDLAGAHPVAVADILATGGPGPAAVPVEDHTHVPGNRPAGELPAQPPLVQQVEQIPDGHNGQA